MARPDRFTGKVAFVTGAASGIGAARLRWPSLRKVRASPSSIGRQTR